MPYYLQTDEGEEYEFDDDVPEEEAVSWLQEALDVGRMVGQNAAASVAAGLTGIGSAIYNQDVGQAVEDMEAVQEKLGYQPQTIEGQAIAAGLGAAGQAWEAPFNAAGEWVTDTTGSPFLGAAVRTAPEALLGGSFKRAMDAPKNKTLTVPDPKTPLTRQKGQFIGPTASEFDAGVANVVKRRIDVGDDPVKLFNATGYFKGLDGEMRKYSPNTTFMQKKGFVDKVFQDKDFLSGVGDKTFSAKSVLPPDDPMVKGYGQALAKTKIKFEYDHSMPRTSSGYISPNKDGSFEIVVKSGSPHSAKVAIVHEMQHLVQNLEKWKGTGTSDTMFKKGYPTAKDIAKPVNIAALMKKYDLTWDETIPATENINFWIREIEKGSVKMPNQKAKEASLNLLRGEMKHLTEVYRARHPMRRYETNAGEVEARISEDWAGARPHMGLPTDAESLQQSVRNYAALDRKRTITPDDIHYDKYDLGASQEFVDGFGNPLDHVSPLILKQLDKK